MDMLSQSRPVRAAAAQALCNLSLEAASGTAEAAERHASNKAAAVAAAASSSAPSSSQLSTQVTTHPAWTLLFDALGTVVPALCNMLLKADFSEGPMTACQTLSNLMRGAAFVPRVLKLLGPLVTLAKHLASSASEPMAKQMFAQMLLNAALHSGTASALDSADAPQVGPVPVLKWKYARNMRACMIVSHDAAPS